MKVRDFAINLNLLIAISFTLSGCAANPHPLAATTSTSTSSTAQANAEAALGSVKVQFDYQDFFTLTNPNSVGCAGDAKNYFDPLATQTLSSGQVVAAPYATDTTNTSTTIKPSFIKNISVDMTDANSTSAANQALGCSYGSGSSSTPSSSCASFDFPDNGGMNSNLSGSILILGGVQGSNYSAISESTSSGIELACGTTSTSGTPATSCATSVFALGVDSLPSSAATDPVSTLAPGLLVATEPISSFANLSSATSYSGPTSFVGAAGAYDSGTGVMSLFGGSSLLSGLSSFLEGGTNDKTWLFSVAEQKWIELTALPALNPTLVRTYEQDYFSSRYLSNLITARSIFGFTPVQGISISNNTGSSPFSTTGSYASTSQPQVNSTDQLVIAGGLDSVGIVADSYRFDPTYGPSWIDTLGRSLEANGQIPNGSTPPGAGELVQWLQSYHTVPLFNTSASGSFPSAALVAYPAQPYPVASVSPSPSPTPVSIINFGLTALRDNSNPSGSGYLLMMGGFDPSQASGHNPSLESCYTGVGGGSCAMMIARRSGRSLGSAWAASGEAFSGNFSSVGNLLSPSVNLTSGATGTITQGKTYSTTQLTPSYWDSYKAASGVPYYGGSTLLPGFFISSNDVVFFGGTDCGNYLYSTAVCTSFSNPGAYFQLGSDPLLNSGNGNSIPTGARSITIAGSAPSRAGMAAARGTDAQGNPLIVAYGGMTAAGQAGSPDIYYLYNSGGTNPPAPTWAKFSATTVSPAVVTNGQLAFSHVTKKFYLFGGYNSLSGIQLGDTWELSVTGPNNCGAAGGCQFSWRQLNITGGLACSPNCPAARRSHRMVEVNYNNQNPGGSLSSGGQVLASGEPACSESQPCSYGIFMQGGTTDGMNPLGDRWMFDPTANGGYGLWQLMNEMPARTFSSMSSADYTLPGSNQAVHRAVLFGGETGFSNPNWSVLKLGSTSTPTWRFVAPTLGDTWIFDYDSSTWNRVQLFGQGYNGMPTSFATETLNRQAYNATLPDSTDSRSINGHLSELSPPPTAGAILVTRTLSGPVSSGSSVSKPLKIPEVYLIGGRLKDGSWQKFDHVYKFCIGSSGESYYLDPGGSGAFMPNPNDLSCDAYDSSTNSSSLSPSAGYVGRWLRKEPSSATGYSSFLGAGAYDSTQDLIVVYGGLQFSSIDTAVTDSNQRSISPNIFEYSPPSASHSQGVWSSIAPCDIAAAPTARYGHSMVYDSQHQQLVVIGGYDLTGAQLTQSVSSLNGSYSIPDIWAATRNTSGVTVCYDWRQINTIGNSFSTTSSSPPLGGLSHMIAAFIPSANYNSGYYASFDSACDGVGPIATTDPNISKLLAGGVYFDIDRTQLGANENLLLNLSFIPLGQANQSPSSTLLAASDEAAFRIHLVKTGQSESELQRVLQPRYLTYTGNASYPETVQSLSVLSPPTGQPRTEQILIPLGIDPGIDRIRIERYSGSGIIIEASLFRMGSK